MRRAFVVCCLFWSCAARAGTSVWIDTDPAIGAPWREVDDAFALVLAFHSPEIEIAGLSSSYGNAGLPRTTEVARELVRRFGQEAGLSESDVHPGAASAGDRARKTEASAALARALQKGKLTYIALGPLTNLAAFLRLHPEAKDRIERVIFIGGRSPGRELAFGPDGRRSVHDANVFKDPAAARFVLQSSIPIVLAPVEIAPQLALRKAELRAIRDGGPAGRYLSRRSRVWLWFWTGFVGEKGGLAFDLLALLPALRSDLVVTEERYAGFDEAGDLLAYPRRDRARRPVKFVTGVRAKAKPFVIERLRRRPD